MHIATTSWVGRRRKRSHIRRSREEKRSETKLFTFGERGFTKYFGFGETVLPQSEVSMQVLCVYICMGDSNNLWPMHPVVIIYEVI